MTLIAISHESDKDIIQCSTDVFLFLGACFGCPVAHMRHLTPLFKLLSNFEHNFHDKVCLLGLVTTIRESC
jgi:hypothetical protein